MRYVGCAKSVKICKVLQVGFEQKACSMLSK